MQFPGPSSRKLRNLWSSRQASPELKGRRFLHQLVRHRKPRRKKLSRWKTARKRSLRATIKLPDNKRRSSPRRMEQKMARQGRSIGGAVGASGSASGRAQEEGSGVGTGDGDFFGSGNFIDNGDGTYTARGSGGIPYKIKYEETPKYPRIARDLGFNKVVSVRIRFLVGLDGRVETAEVLTKKIPDLGFREAALEAIRKMEFEPIVYRGRNIKMYFVKRIVFQP